MWPDRLVLVRHAQSIGNTMSEDDRVRHPTGSNLYELTALGREQARITGEWMREHVPNPNGFYTSYYTRTRGTAAALYPGREPYVDERLAEAQRGIWHAMARAEIARVMPWELDRKEREGIYHYRPPGGESCPDIELRIRSFNHTIHRRYPGKTLVIVTHGNWLLLWKKVIEHWTIDEYVATYRHPEREGHAENASVTTYRGVTDPATGRNVLVPDPDMPYIVPWEGQLDASSTIS